MGIFDFLRDHQVCSLKLSFVLSLLFFETFSPELCRNCAAITFSDQSKVILFIVAGTGSRPVKLLVSVAAISVVYVQIQEALQHYDGVILLKNRLFVW